MNKLIRKISRFTQAHPPHTISYSSEKIIEIAPLKALYIPVPKVACSSIKRVMATLIDVEIPGEGVNVHRANFPVVDISALDQYTHYWKFGFVRNPWDRLVSCYSEKIKPDSEFVGKTNSFVKGVHKGLVKYGVFEANMPFDAFLKAIVSIPDHEADQHFRSQHTFLTDTHGHLFANFVGKFETMDEDFQYVMQTLKAPSAITLSRSNKTRHSPYRKYYTDSLMDLFQKRYSKDISLFEYEF